MPRGRAGRNGRERLRRQHLGDARQPLEIVDVRAPLVEPRAPRLDELLEVREVGFEERPPTRVAHVVEDVDRDDIKNAMMPAIEEFLKSQPGDLWTTYQAICDLSNS